METKFITGVINEMLLKDNAIVNNDYIVKLESPESFLTKKERVAIIDWM